MKRLIAMILCLCTIMMLTLAPITSASAAKGGYQYVNSYKNGGPINLRSDPNMKHDPICKLEHRTEVLVYEYNKQRTWAYIETDNPKGKGTVKGWISTEFLSKKDPGSWKERTDITAEVIGNLSAVAAKIKPVEVPFSTTITTKNPSALVHLRWFPNTSAKYLDAFPRGTEVTLIAKSSKWAQIIYTPADTDEMHVGFVLLDNIAVY